MNKFVFNDVIIICIVYFYSIALENDVRKKMFFFFRKHAIHFFKNIYSTLSFQFYNVCYNSKVSKTVFSIKFYKNVL